LLRKRNCDSSSFFLLFLFFGNVEEKFIEMEITTEQFTCGFTPKAHKNCFFNVAPIARIPGQADGISQAPAIFQLAILHLCPLSESICDSFSNFIILSINFLLHKNNLFLLN
jgi:hypothetical protein